MKQLISLKNTVISFTASFSGNGWETSLMPHLEHTFCKQHTLHIHFGWIKRMFSKMPRLGRLRPSSVAPLDASKAIQSEHIFRHLPRRQAGEGGRSPWMSVLARLFL